MNDISVATEFLRQLGGNKFMAMIGSKCWTYDDRSITLKMGFGEQLDRT